MNQLPSPEIIGEIAAVHFLQKETSDRVRNLVSKTQKDEWGYKVIRKGMQTTTFLVTLGDKKFALKISNDEKFKGDTDTELWLREKQGQNNPQIFSNGEGQLPRMTDKYFWNIQEYISGPLWKEANINDTQLHSYLSQLRSLHDIHQSGNTGWGKVMPNHDGESENFSGYVEKFIRKIHECVFFSQEGRRDRVMRKIGDMQKKIGDMSNYTPVLVHNDAHTENVILDTSASCRLIDYGNIKWSCPEEELAVIQTHCVGSRMGLFKRIFDGYKKRHAFNDSLFQFFALLNACSKINTRKNPEKQLLIWKQLMEPILEST